ncbi:exonuclease III [Metarhizium album ARSEF 1941]|uniref:Exonuclease III n=1 Tax=Metarhizium album (strain ARSEF 1941) TaxID=1081103 RepID=A0A0B2WS39_METAS|nr:exonuclease III [Metarhizium album ARSEF 1941]KHN95760.1 exonuclease III [Metarhizium album ARSEF 1941]
MSGIIEKAATMDEKTELHHVSRPKRDTSGSLDLAPTDTAFTQCFSYATRHASKRNWIGVYPSGSTGPENETYTGDSLSWGYAQGDKGVVQLSTENLPPGQYKAYFLADEGYKWLAKPVVFKVANPWGSISVSDAGSSFTFKYSTPLPDSQNWIGIYNSFGGGPKWQRFISGSLTWAYAPDRNGTVKIDASALQPGLRYRAFFLAKGGYKWLANPIEIAKPGNGPLAFIVDQLTTHNARVGEPFHATLSGMLENPRDANSKFAKGKYSAADARTHGWVDISNDGVLSGTPPKAYGNTTTEFIVEALGSDGSTAEITVVIPVIPKGQLLVRELTVLSFNLWFGGTQVKDYHAKQIRFITNAGADIVGLQESTGGHAIRLANAMGWDHWQGDDVGIISRYPMVKQYGPVEAAGAVRIALDRGHEINFWNCHLGYTPYGPYDFCFDHLSPDEVLKNEAKSRRTPQIVNIMKHMQNHLSQSGTVPVIFAGDFNAPSHLDWTNATRELHCGIGYFPWPTSKHPVDAGMVDSFREVHGDPLTKPGITWSPIYLDNEGRTEPKDRIDFIYHKGLKTISSEAVVVGQPKAQPDHYYNEWPSDHAAVKTVFKVDNDGSSGSGDPRVRWGMFSAVIAATVACASWIIRTCIRKRKSGKDFEKGGKDGDSSGTSE